MGVGCHGLCRGGAQPWRGSISFQVPSGPRTAWPFVAGTPGDPELVELCAQLGTLGDRRGTLVID